MTSLEGTGLDGGWTRRWIEAVAAEVSRRKQELTALDRAIGDADHGENLDRGFQAVLGKLDALDESKVIATPPAIDEQPKRLSQPELAPASPAEVARAEQAALSDTGVGRPDLDFSLVEPPVAPAKKGKSA